MDVAWKEKNAQDQREYHLLDAGKKVEKLFSRRCSYPEGHIQRDRIKDQAVTLALRSGLKTKEIEGWA